MKLSIIIVNFNTKKLLANCLNSIFAYPYDEELEVLVVDNASSDGSSEMISKTYPQIKLISNRENLGFSRANNQGIRESKGTYMLLLNSDTEILEGALKAMCEFMDDNPQAGAISCQLLLPDGTPQPFTYGQDPTLSYLIRRIIRMLSKQKYMHSWTGEGAVETEWVTGACMMVRREAVDSAGYLDENIFMYFEDNEWCHRMRKQGWKIYFLPQVRVVHLGGRSLAADDPGRKAEYYKSLIYFYQKHYSLPAQIFLRGLLRFYRLVLARQTSERMKEAGN